MSDIIGKRIRNLRTSNELTIDDLAKILNTNRSTVSKIETGQTSIKSQMIADAASYFKVSSDYLLGLTDVPSNDELKRLVESVMNDKGNTSMPQLAEIIIKKLEEKGLMTEANEIPDDKIESIVKLIDSIIDLASMQL